MTGLPLERIVAALVLASAAWPTFRPATSPAFRRTVPAAARRLAVLLALYAVGVLAIAVVAPTWVLRILVGLALGLLLAIEWHSVAARGRRRRWPPGSLRPFSLRPWLERDFFFAQQRRHHGSPFKAPQFLRPTACVVGLADGLELFRAHEASLGSPALPFGRFIPGGFLRHMTPERHLAGKEIFRNALTREVYEPLAPFIRDVIRGELAHMADASQVSGGRGVPPRPHLQRAVFATWARLFFHVAPGTPELERLKELYAIIDIRNPSGHSDRTIRAALAEITGVLRQQLARTNSAAAGRPQSFLSALAQSRPDAVADPTTIGNLTYMMHTTWADVSGLLQWLFRMLTEHDEWAERLRRAPDAGVAEPGHELPLANRIVMETLRLEQSEYLYRVANRTIEHAGHVIPRGWLVRLCVRESHQDPAVFANPQAFDPDRFLHHTYARHQYAPFGAGLRHACLGEGLTKTVGTIFVEELARGYRWRTVADGPYEQSAWRHWRPSSNWRVLVTPTA